MTGIVLTIFISMGQCVMGNRTGDKKEDPVYQFSAYMIFANLRSQRKIAVFED